MQGEINTMKFQKVLIANRGEIAVRIIRACRELGIKTVGIYSKADRYALHVRLADEAYCVGPASSKESYLNMTSIISVAIATDCDAIHPGYGFLSENVDFAEICAACHIEFIGPSPQAISKMGDKATARQTMSRAGIPIIPGSKQLVYDVADAIKIASAIGYPVMIKATAGGGGKGIRIARDDMDLVQQMTTAKEEAYQAFDDDGVYIEKYLTGMKHVEVQIIADKYGNVVHLGERDCSIQRRRQKLVEEAPCPVLTEEMRTKMGSAAVQAALAVKYYGAGTLEFLLSPEGEFYFLEMNTRIQVEHPVTEMVTGIDLVKEMICVAQGQPLSFTQQQVVIQGCAIQCRINAEDAKQNFRPVPGVITQYVPSGGLGVRVDGAAYSGYTIPPFYDSMIAKLIVWDKTRDAAITKMKCALAEFVIEGISTTLPFHQALFNHCTFVQGTCDVSFLEKNDVYEI